MRVARGFVGGAASRRGRGPVNLRVGVNVLLTRSTGTVRGGGMQAQDSAWETPAVDPSVLEVTAVPAGLWVRACGTAAARPDDPAWQAAAVPGGAVTVIVGAPGEPAPDAPAVADLLRALPTPRPDGVVLARYGAESSVEPAGGAAGSPDSDAAGVLCLPRRLAALLGRPLLAQHGLLLAGADGSLRVTAVDVGRGSWWHPLVEQSVYPPTGPPRPSRWRAPAPGLPELGHGGYRLFDDWIVQLVPAGLVVRRADRPADADADAAPHDPGRLDLLLDVVPAELSDGALTALGRLADALPSPARSRLRLLLPADISQAQALRLRWAVPAPQQLRTGRRAVDGPQPAAVRPRPAGRSPQQGPAGDLPPDDHLPTSILAEHPRDVEPSRRWPDIELPVTAGAVVDVPDRFPDEEAPEAADEPRPPFAEPSAVEPSAVEAAAEPSVAERSVAEPAGGETAVSTVDEGPGLPVALVATLLAVSAGGRMRFVVPRVVPSAATAGGTVRAGP